MIEMLSRYHKFFSEPTLLKRDIQMVLLQTSRSCNSTMESFKSYSIIVLCQCHNSNHTWCTTWIGFSVPITDLSYNNSLGFSSHI